MVEGTCSMSALNLHVVILAGGRSSRMGCDKRFLELGGESILDRAIRIARSWIPCSGQVLLSGDVEGYSCVKDLISGQGPLGGLYTAILELKKSGSGEETWALLMPVDMPRIDHLLLDTLVQPLVMASAEQRTQMEAIRFEGYELPCLFKVTARLEKFLLEFLNEVSPSARSIRNLFERLNLQYVTLKSESLDCMANVNTPDDLLRVREKL